MLLLIQHDKSQETLQYFPPDQTVQFTEAVTMLDLLSPAPNKGYQIQWAATSSTNQSVYLRQDISLLFQDGLLKGVKSLWKESVADLALEKTFQESGNHLFQAVSYHHGEVHYPEDQIRSIQQMSKDNLYIFTDSEAWEETGKEEQTKWNQAIYQQLDHTWQQWMSDHQLDSNRYEQIPLSDILQFQQHPISGFTQAETDQIIGQLWEGLYRNYLIPLIDKKEFSEVTMPLLLISKAGDHLLVLYNIDDQQGDILYQQINKSH
ncbi:hypothetical protein [Gracilibacillus phocaeensis]|uniref:hypothetical protein n=1 Tax=Gracilibacillus phocaeensis TaxID=2042304 RepID=UPI0013EEFA59|nr:hypothetical protein [Gracilibacillus phocaeensis]